MKRLFRFELAEPSWERQHPVFRVAMFFRCQVFLLVISLAAIVAADEATVKRFGSEAPAGWRQIEKEYDGKEFVVQLEDLEGSLPTNFSKKKTFSRLGGNIRIESELFRNGELENYVDVYNQDYEASVREYPKGQWYIGKCKPAEALGYGRFSIALPSLCAAKDYYLPGCIVKYGNVSKEAGIAFILNDAWTQTDEEGNEVVTVDFLYGLRQENSEFAVDVDEKYSQGFVFRVDFLPQRNWCCKKVEFVYPSIGKYVKTEAIFSGPGSHPSEILVFEGKQGETEFKLKIRERYSELKSRSLSENDFRLTGFGLIEPPEFLKNRPFFSWGTMALSIAIFGSALIAIRHLLHRKQSA